MINISVIFPNISKKMISISRAIRHILMECEGEKPSCMPPKVFTERYELVEYPDSVIKHKRYNLFESFIRIEVVCALKNIYKDKFFSSGAEDVEREQKKKCINSKKDKDTDTDKYQTQIEKYVSNVVSYFAENYPPEKILSIGYREQFILPQKTHEKSVYIEPDIVVYKSEKEIFIYDIKVFTRTSSYTNKIIRLFISSYAAIARENGLKCNSIGVIMPWGREEAVKTFDITKWKQNALVEKLYSSVDRILYAPLHRVKWVNLLESYSVGRHTDIESIEMDLIDHNLPLQIFLYGASPSQKDVRICRQIMGTDVADKKLLLDFSKFNVFVHAPYSITLASPEPYIAESIKMYLQDSYAVGAKGVVIHTGHHPDEEEGLKIMKSNMDKIKKFIRAETPLIIETPCCNKNEMLNTPSKLSEFVMGYQEDLVGICVDTCHVFVGGIQPLDYLEELKGENHFKPNAFERVCLVHFNGSRKKFGCCADGHAYVTEMNNIPDEQLEGVLEIASKYKIPCLTE